MREALPNIGLARSRAGRARNAAASGHPSHILMAFKKACVGGLRQLCCFTTRGFRMPDTSRRRRYALQATDRSRDKSLHRAQREGIPLERRTLGESAPNASLRTVHRQHAMRDNTNTTTRGARAVARRFGRAEPWRAQTNTLGASEDTDRGIDGRIASLAFMLLALHFQSITSCKLVGSKTSPHQNTMMKTEPPCPVPDLPHP